MWGLLLYNYLSFNQTVSICICGYKYHPGVNELYNNPKTTVSEVAAYLPDSSPIVLRPNNMSWSKYNNH